jgi:hypothetical protein
LAICLLAVGSWVIPAAAQGGSGQLRPELGIYVQQGEIFRFSVVDSAISNPSNQSWDGYFTLYFEAALKPVFRRELRNQADVYRRRYLTFRTGYRYRTSLTSGQSTSENRGILEVTSRYMLPWQLIVADRNRGEFRFIKGQGFSTRYRNRLRLERDFKLGAIVFTPYVYDEIFFDSRYNQWTPNRYSIGFEFPVGPHVVLEPYYLAQKRNRSDPPNIHAFGFTLNLYF